MELLMRGKQGLIVGVANKRSIAWGIAQAVAAQGARLAITYQGERLAKNVEELAEGLDNPLVLPCDVTSDDEIDKVMATIQANMGGLDFLVHSVAYAPAGDLDKPVVDVSRAGYQQTQDISVYSLMALAKSARPLFRSGASILTLTYYGAEKVVPGYNVMGVAKAALESTVRYLANELGPDGIRVNALSAGPLNTLAARGISGFSQMRNIVSERAPLRRPMEMDEVSNAGLFLLSRMSSGITGEVLHADGGYHVMGM